MENITSDTVFLFILEMNEAKEEPKIILKGVCNPNGAGYDVRYLQQDAANIFISFINWRGAYPDKTDEEVLQILIKAYYQNK